MRVQFAPITAALLVAVSCGCSSGDVANMENEWPDLSDLVPATDTVATAEEHDNIIRSLRDEAELRKSEGYQAPEGGSDENSN